MDAIELLEGGEVVSSHDRGLVVEVDGVELYVGTIVQHSGCRCCGDTAALDASYNQTSDTRLERHGSEDPLDILD